MDITDMEEITYTDIEEEDSHITIRTDGTTGIGIVAIITKLQVALLNAFLLLLSSPYPFPQFLKLPLLLPQPPHPLHLEHETAEKVTMNPGILLVN